MIQAHKANSILLVEDDPSLRHILGKTLALEGFSVLQAEHGKQALEILQENDEIALILSDVQMQPIDGHALLKECKKRYARIPVILMTAYGTIENAVHAMHDGAVDYLVKPFEPAELLKMVARFVQAEVSQSSPAMTAAESQIESDANTGATHKNFIAVDEKSIQLAQVAKRVAATDVTVMITGESGVGKEVISRFIHENSARSAGPFMAINCAAIPENMLESVLFGYEKGAYTGAYQSRAGKFEQAQGGTLLLDEITEMDMGLQAKLLRVLQEKEVERLGGRKVIPLDVRILATTNRDIRQYVEHGKFREDLFYRLNVFPLNILPLCQRPDDILPLANKMLSSYSEEFRTVAFSESAQRVLKQHPWPGNVRELENVIQRSLILRTGSIIDINDLQFEDAVHQANYAAVIQNPVDETDKAQATGLNGDLKAREKDLIISALNTKNSRKEVAEKLGISPRTLRYKLARLRESGVALPA